MESNASMRPITFSLTNILKFISFMSPLLISFFMIMYSILTNNIIKGLVFVVGVTIVTFLNYILKNMLKNPQTPLASPFCNVLPAPFTVSKENNIYNSPSLSSTIIGFTTGFLIFPMKMNNQMNPALIMFMFALLGVNGMIEYWDNCTDMGGVVLGSLVGIFFGIVYYTLIKVSGNKEVAYFSEIISNNTQCSKPNQTQFRCRTYRAGEQLPGHGTTREQQQSTDPMAICGLDIDGYKPEINTCQQKCPPGIRECLDNTSKGQLGKSKLGNTAIINKLKSLTPYTGCKGGLEYHMLNGNRSAREAYDYMMSRNSTLRCYPGYNSNKCRNKNLGDRC